MVVLLTIQLITIIILTRANNIGSKSNVSFMIKEKNELQYVLRPNYWPRVGNFHMSAPVWQKCISHNRKWFLKSLEIVVYFENLMQLLND
jgi:hypothetical protein